MIWRWAFILLNLSACATFIALGNWQLDRLSWKKALISRVEQRVSAPAVPAPTPGQWRELSRESHEYLHVSLYGRFLAEYNTLVVAATEKGSGYWVLTPLLTDNHGTVLINRGYIGQGAQPAPAPGGEVTVSGLLRLTEPDGGFLRANDPAAKRWYSRDVVAIGSALSLSLAPYFVDADTGQPGSAGNVDFDGEQSVQNPLGGLTVINFSNSHRVYALTWYTLALMAAGACVFLFRDHLHHSKTRP
ncbi:SURF1 family protein [Litorivivens sp.]|uniref:SURF1 family protein n=1 Tax=Litorivivens sp. TaxID=2020868 RepID=UPI00356A3789